ncbi:MAG: hypothetical protein UZ22_OP11002000721 [Microgenomates bacterium OLB23]|nr:MAG: hypothetical protein UZ22_OP11002000721 [Microgenomates bacterium OLB23]
MAKLENLEKDISAIKARNKQVELDKQWETSCTRRVLIIAFTYIALGLYMQAIHIPNPWLNAIVPTTGFYLSTLTMPFFRKLWEKYIRS